MTVWVMIVVQMMNGQLTQNFDVKESYLNQQRCEVMAQRYNNFAKESLPRSGKTDYVFMCIRSDVKD